MFLPPSLQKRIPTLNFSYVNCGNDLILTGGQFADDKTCSIDSYRVDVMSGQLTDLNASLKQARMLHSMIIVEEKQMILAVGGEDENCNLLNSCESYSTQDNQWKVLNTLNNPGKQMSLCKFNTSRNGEKRILVYAFNKQHIERVNLS